MKKRTALLLLVLSCLSLVWLAGCGPARLAGGTETQNPEIVACVKKMAQAAFDAADAGSAWQPNYYLQDSAHGASLGKTAKRTAVPDSSLMAVEPAPKSDTAIIGDSVAIIRDTAFFVMTKVIPDTLLVNKTLFIADTLTDTIRSAAGGNRISIVTRAVTDSIMVKDTVILADTIVRQYKRVIVSVRHFSEGLAGIAVQADTNWIDLGAINGISGDPDTSRKQFDTATPEWKIDIAYQPDSSSIAYQITNSPANDTIIIVPNQSTWKSAPSIRNNQLFISSATFDNNILVETIRFTAIDSLLSIVRFNPSTFDTVESLTINYSIDPGTNQYSGADDQLRAIEQSSLYRLGKIQQLYLILSPDPANSLDITQRTYSGMISMNIAYSGSKTGVFSGIVDANMTLIGVYEIDGKKYQVSCDHLYTTHIFEISQ